MKKSAHFGKVALFSCLLFLCSAWVAFDTLFAPFERGYRRVEIPDFVGDIADSATFDTWQDVEIIYTNHQEAPSGVIISQEPPAGSLRKLSTREDKIKLTVTVSLGPAHAMIPNLVGVDVREASAQLRALGFSVQTRMETGAYPEGEVLSVLPESGTELPLGKTVVLTVSAGSPQRVVTVPDVRGMSRNDALITLWLSGLGVEEVVEIPTEDPAKEGQILKQSYRPGTRVRAGTEVTIFAGQAPTE